MHGTVPRPGFLRDMRRAARQRWRLSFHLECLEKAKKLGKTSFSVEELATGLKLEGQTLYLRFDADPLLFERLCEMGLQYHPHTRRRRFLHAKASAQLLCPAA